jgi:hypothetical protein
MSLCSIEGPNPGTIRKADGAHNFLGLQDHILMTVGRDVMNFEGGGPANANYASFDTPSGRRQVSQYQPPNSSLPALNLVLFLFFFLFLKLRGRCRARTGEAMCPLTIGVNNLYNMRNPVHASSSPST